MSILVTGVGGGVGQSVLKSLQGTKYRVVSADAEPLATGLYTTPKGYLIPYVTAPDFTERLLQICATEKVRILFPGLDLELARLAENRAEFARIGTTVIVSDPAVIALCDDKLLTAEFLRLSGFPHPQTSLLRDVTPSNCELPLVVKPKIGGSRSQGVRIAKNIYDLTRAQSELDGTAYVAQKFIDGPEYTCGTINLGERCVGAIVARRILRDGDTYKAFIERNETLEAFVRDVADQLKPFGACNIQLRIKNGVPIVFEINPRCSGTTYCRTIAGFNEPKAIVDFLLDGIEPSFSIRSLTVLRFWKEMVLENDAVARCEFDGSVTGPRSSL